MAEPVVAVPRASAETAASEGAAHCRASAVEVLGRVSAAAESDQALVELVPGPASGA